MTHTPCFCSVRQAAPYEERAGEESTPPEEPAAQAAVSRPAGLRRFRQLGAAVQCLRIRRVRLQDDQRRAQTFQCGACLAQPGYRLKLHVRLRGCER